MSARRLRGDVRERLGHRLWLRGGADDGGRLRGRLCGWLGGRLCRRLPGWPRFGLGGTGRRARLERWRRRRRLGRRRLFMGQGRLPSLGRVALRALVREGRVPRMELHGVREARFVAAEALLVRSLEDVALVARDARCLGVRSSERPAVVEHARLPRALSVTDDARGGALTDVIRCRLEIAEVARRALPGALVWRRVFGSARNEQHTKQRAEQSAGHQKRSCRNGMPSRLHTRWIFAPSPGGPQK
jgi:hypothetical protein